MYIFKHYTYAARLSLYRYLTVRKIMECNHLYIYIYILTHSSEISTRASKHIHSYPSAAFLVAIQRTFEKETESTPIDVYHLRFIDSSFASCWTFR
jgi:hypothetical protein